MTRAVLKKRFKKRESLIPRTIPDTGDPLSEQPPVLSGSSTASAKVSYEALESRRRIFLYFVLALVFMRFSMVHQILEHLLHVDTYLIYLVAIPALVGVPAAGGFKRTFQYRSAMYWTAFALWMIPTSVFSTWRGGSVSLINGYYRTEFLMLFAIGGLVTTWRECRWLLYTISAAALVNVISFFFFRQLDENGRTSLTFGTVANSNDYSAHLLYVLPFLLWVILITKSKYLRIAGLLVVALGLFEILAAGSRGAMIGLVSAILVFAFTTTAKLRRIVLLTAPILGILVFALLPSSVSHRIFAFSANGSQDTSEALESSHSREQVLRDSVTFAIQHPLLGLGPGQFGNNEGQQTTKSGEKLWIEAHNSFAQIASENGFPGFIFYIGGMLSSLLLLNKTGRLFVGKPNLERSKRRHSVCSNWTDQFLCGHFFREFWLLLLPSRSRRNRDCGSSVEQTIRGRANGSQEEAQAKNAVQSTSRVEPRDC